MDRMSYGEPFSVIANERTFIVFFPAETYNNYFEFRNDLRLLSKKTLYFLDLASLISWLNRQKYALARRTPHRWQFIAIFYLFVPVVEVDDARAVDPVPTGEDLPSVVEEHVHILSVTHVDVERQLELKSSRVMSYLQA